MKSKWIEDRFNYDGSQLRSLFAYLKYNLMGPSIVSWTGSCDVSLDHMVDGEDLLAGEKICGQEMLHFIVEVFSIKLFSGVCLQRLLASIVMQELRKNCKDKVLVEGLFRDGDDLYLEDRKLTISIATQSPTSTLIHFAINVTNEGTPVKTACLEDLSLEPQPFAKAVMKSFVQEFVTVEEATQKVKWVL